MDSKTESPVGISYAAVFGLIRLHFWKLLGSLVVYCLVYGLLLVALATLFATLWFSIERFVRGNTTVINGLLVVLTIAFMAAIAVLWSALSSSVLKIYRMEDKLSTVDNRVFTRMFLLIILISFLQAAVTITCTGLFSVAASFVDNKELIVTVSVICTIGLNFLVALLFLFAPFCLVDGASLSDALNGSLSIVTKNFIWLIPVIIVVALTHVFFGFGIAILGAVYFLTQSSVARAQSEPQPAAAQF